MAGQLSVVHYVNQFFGGYGAEEKANLAVQVKEGYVGSGRPLQQALGDKGRIVATIVCGDNYFHDEKEKALEAIRKALDSLRPDAVVAGPAFEAGRYGLACGEVCKVCREMGIPSVTGMHPENTAVASFRQHAVIVPTSETPAGMQQAMAQMAGLAVKLGTGLPLGPAEAEGYLPTGLRNAVQASEIGAKRAIDMLVAKVSGRSYKTEIPISLPERVPPAPAIVDLRKATIALISTGGLIPKGNPDRQKSRNPERFFRYSVEGMDTLTSDHWEAYHGGYFNPTSSRNPNYILPLSFVRAYQRQGVVGNIHSTIFTMPGVSTPVDKARRFGKEIAVELKEAGVDGAMLVAT